MKFELRQLRHSPWPVALAIRNGPVIDGQAATNFKIISEPGDVTKARLTVDFLVIDDIMPIRREEDLPDWPQDLAKASEAFSLLSSENKRRFAVMYADDLRAAMPLKDDPRLVRQGRIYWPEGYNGNPKLWPLGHYIPDDVAGQTLEVYAIKEES